jgi:hypothetical protein
MVHVTAGIVHVTNPAPGCERNPTRWGVVMGGGGGGGGGGGDGGDGGGGGDAKKTKTILRYFFIPMWVHVRGSVDLGGAARVLRSVDP